MKKSRSLTFTIGDLLGKPKTPPCLVKEACTCGNPATVSVSAESQSFNNYETVKVCTDCAAKMSSESE